MNCPVEIGILFQCVRLTFLDQEFLEKLVSQTKDTGLKVLNNSFIRTNPCDSDERSLTHSMNMVFWSEEEEDCCSTDSI